MSKYICDHEQFNQSLLDCVGWGKAYYDPICQEKCPDNCEESYFDFRATASQSFGDWWDVIALYVFHRNAPDTTHEHVPIMTWIDLVSSFGGLLGMWLGFSFVFIIDFFIKFMKV